MDRVLADLSLTGCADQRIGNVDYRGISGGQRKRVSIALELLVNPSVMFVDGEAHSGVHGVRHGGWHLSRMTCPLALSGMPLWYAIELNHQTRLSVTSLTCMLSNLSPRPPEPTSGLDAKMAEDVVNTLSKLASEGRNLITTIHQPSYKIFRKFDRFVCASCAWGRTGSKLGR